MDTLKNEELAIRAEDLEGTALETDTGDAEEDLVLKLSKPYNFDGQAYTEVDLHGLEDVTTATLENVGKIYGKKKPGANPALMEMDMAYCVLLAQRVSKLPLEFFNGLPARDAIKLKTLVTNFLYGGDGED